MQRFQKILYINDPPNTAHALQRALRLAHANEAQLTIASVGEEFPTWLDELEKPILQAKTEALHKSSDKPNPISIV